MKDIHIIELELKNFAGVAQGTYKFEPTLNEIKGAQGTGKTSSYFAYMWVLGFNVSKWEPKIEVYRIHNIETSVTLKLAVDNLIYTIKRVNTPKYKIDKFTGKEEYYNSNSQFYIDDEKCKTQEAFRLELEKIYGLSYQTIELLSSIDLFNTQSNNWDSSARRKYLFDLFKINEKTDTLKDLPELESIRDYLDKGKDENAIKQILATEKTSIDKELNANNALLQDKVKELGEYSGLNFNALEERKSEILKEMDTLRNNTDILNQQVVLKELYDKLANLKAQLLDEENKQKNIDIDFQRKSNELNSQLRNVLYEIDTINKNIEGINEKIKLEETKKKDVENETLSDDETICPTCHQPLPEEEIKRIVKKFNATKAERLQNIVLNISNLSVETQNYRTRLNTLANDKNALETQINTFNDMSQTKDTSLIDKLNQEINEIQDKIKNVGTSDNEQITTKQKELQSEYENIISQLSQQTNLEKIKSKIEELKARNLELAVEDGKRVEKSNALKKYIEEKVKLVNEEINKHFEKVSYVFFEFNSATAQNEYKSICECVIDGRTYSCMSSGEKVEANFYTTKSLRKILNVAIPQFVDDVAISDVKKDIKEWQTTYFITDKNYKVPVTLISDVYTLQDCDVR